MQQLERRAVGPLEVLQHEQDRPLRGELAEELGEAPVQPRLHVAPVSRVAAACVAVANAGQMLASVAAVAAREHRERRRRQTAQHGGERVGEHRVRHARLHRDTRARP